VRFSQIQGECSEAVGNPRPIAAFAASFMLKGSHQSHIRLMVCGML